MFEINKQEFGAFVSQLRREKGYTQKDLAQRLFISDKAISKWENAVSIPDTTLLIPLAELLGVSVTELLMCRRLEENRPMDSHQVESIVKTAINYADEAPQRAYTSVGKWAMTYILSLVAGGIGLLLCGKQGQISETTLVCVILGAVFGAYFCFFARTKLPDYYDQNRIGGVMDGPFRMNVPGLVFNNSNWPYIILVGRIWSCVCCGLYPLLSAAMQYFAGGIWLRYGEYILLALLLGGLFVPMYWVGKKYQ